MKPLTHKQAQMLLQAGKEASAADQDALTAHLAGCQDCRSYGALVGELSRTLPELYPAAAMSERDIRKKVSDRRADLSRRFRFYKLISAMRPVAWLGASLIILVVLALLLPHLLPHKVSGPETPTPQAQPTHTSSPALSPTAPSPTKPAALTPSPSPENSAGESTPSPASSPISLGQPAWAGRGQIIDAAFLPDGSGVVVGWGSGISLNALDSGKEKWYVEAPAPLLKLDVQPQGQYAAAIFTDSSVLVVDVATGQARRFTESPQSSVGWGSVAWSPDGKTVAYQFIYPPYRGDPIYLLVPATGKLSEVPHSNIDPNTAPQLVWSPDGKTISLAGLGSICPTLLDVATGEARMTLTQFSDCRPESIPSRVATWTPDGSAMAVVSPVGDVLLVSFPDGAVLKTFRADYPVSAHPSTGQSLVFDPSGKWLANRSGVAEYYFAAVEPITVWDVGRGEAIARLDHPITINKLFYRLTSAFHGSSLLMLYSDGSVTRWDFTLSSQENLLFKLEEPSAQLWTLKWSGDGQRLAYTGSWAGVFVYDAASGQAVAHFTGPYDSPALNADGTQLAYFDSQKKEVQVVNIASGDVLLRLPGASLPGGMAFSPDGASLAYSQGQAAAVAEVASGKTQVLQSSPESAPNVNDQVMRLVWSPDGKALVASTGGNPDNLPGKDVLWQRDAAGTFQELTWVEDYQAGYANAVAAVFSPSGKRVALLKEPQAEAGYIDLIVYDLAQGRILQDIKDYYPSMWVDDDILLMRQAADYTWETRLDVNSGQTTQGKGTDTMGNAYAPGGIYFAHPDETVTGIIVSDWLSGEILARGQHGDSISDVSWSPDGRWIATTGVLGTVRIWPVSYK